MLKAKEVKNRLISSVKLFVTKKIPTAIKTILNKIKEFFIELFNKVKALFIEYVVENVKFGFGMIKLAVCTYLRGIFKGGFGIAKRNAYLKLSALYEEVPGAFKRFAVLSSSVGIVVFAICSVVFWNVNTVAVSVNTNGQSVAYVSSKNDFDGIKTVMDEIFVGGNSDKLSPVTLSYGICKKSEIVDVDIAADKALAAQNNVTSAFGLFVDGKYVTCATSESVINEALEVRKNEFSTETTESATIKNSVSVIPVYCFSESGKVSDLSAKDAIRNADLTVETVVIKSYNTTLAYETVTRNDATKVIGYKRISTQGKNGTAVVTSKCVLLNGVEESSEIINTEVVSAPITQIVINGTSKMGASNIQLKLAEKGKTFLWPIKSTSRMYISAYWGDGRGHTGIDITGPEGTPIYAAADGVVTYAGSANGYGRLVIIDHGNGYSTAYGHMSSISVKVGQTVTAGQTIAACGHAGVATGNHIHFEVRIYDTPVNPAPYLGINN